MKHLCNIWKTSMSTCYFLAETEAGGSEARTMMYIVVSNQCQKYINDDDDDDIRSHYFKHSSILCKHVHALLDSNPTHKQHQVCCPVFLLI